MRNIVVVPLTTKQVNGLVQLTPWLDVSSYEDIYASLINADSDDKDSVTFVIETADDKDFPFLNTHSFVLAPGQADSFTERNRFFHYMRLFAKSSEPVDVRYAVMAKDDGKSGGSWKL